MNFVIRLRKHKKVVRSSTVTPHGKRYDWGKWYIHLAKAPHFWSIKGIIDIRGRVFVI